MNPWPQNYPSPGGYSTRGAAVPVALRLGLLAFGHVRAHRAAFIALLMGVLVWLQANVFPGVIPALPEPAASAAPLAGPSAVPQPPGQKLP